ncbi:hypothetical protein LWI28_013260 [Acer negundo]|uniref:Secreted protein n=1 Tax=Acer negundo TaxID=4023 RepID=A0AAD5IPZ8_ACENE|nr:hypothetical protein LWI28_013260 [Acer negundo]
MHALMTLVWSLASSAYMGQLRRISAYVDCCEEGCAVRTICAAVYLYEEGCDVRRISPSVYLPEKGCTLKRIYPSVYRSPSLYRADEWGSCAWIASRVALRWDLLEVVCAVRMNHVPGHVEEQVAQIH